jgi:hypothetical protein
VRTLIKIEDARREHVDGWIHSQPRIKAPLFRQTCRLAK